MKIRFRVRTLLAAVTTLAVPLSWCATNHSAYRAEERLLEQLESPQGYLSVIDSRNRSTCSLGARAIAVREPTTLIARALSGISPPTFERVTRITLMDGDYDDRSLNILSQFPHLAEVVCTKTSITPASIASFQKAKPQVLVTYERTTSTYGGIFFVEDHPKDPFAVSVSAP